MIQILDCMDMRCALRLLQFITLSKAKRVLHSPQKNAKENNHKNRYHVLSDAITGFTRLKCQQEGEGG